MTGTTPGPDDESGARTDRRLYYLAVSTGVFGLIGVPFSFLVAWSGDIVLGLGVFLSAAICVAIGLIVGGTVKIVHGPGSGSA